MKIVMKRRKPLKKSHTKTQAKVNNGQKFQTVSIKQPVEEMTTQHADDDDAAISYNHHAMWETKEQVVAVANLAHRNFDCTLFNPAACMSEILCHAHLELQNVLRNRRFDSVIDSGSSSSAEGEQVVVFAKYNNNNNNSSSNSTSGGGYGGEVWINLNSNDTQVQKFLASSAAVAPDKSTDGNAKRVDDHDNDDDENDDSYEKILVTDTIVSSNHSRRNNFRSSSDLA